MDLTNATIVKIKDLTSCVPGRCCDGGQYSYTTIYQQVDTDRWEINYVTSADFEYCRYCGRFGECDCDSPETVTTAEVLAAIKYAEDHPDERSHPDAEGGYEVTVS